jgi:hypothetical protein
VGESVMVRTRWGGTLEQCMGHLGRYHAVYSNSISTFKRGTLVKITRKPGHLLRIHVYSGFFGFNLGRGNEKTRKC